MECYWCGEDLRYEDSKGRLGRSIPVIKIGDGNYHYGCWRTLKDERARLDQLAAETHQESYTQDDYQIDDIVTYHPFGQPREARRVQVDDKEDNIKNGEPGFAGALLKQTVDGDWVKSGMDVWGYDHQITAVERS